MAEPRKRPTPTLERAAFKTSRLAEFCGAKELERCLIARVPVASLISRPSHSSPSQF
jgi:hypothetical protein